MAVSPIVFRDALNHPTGDATPPMPPLPEGPVRPTGYTSPATISVDLARNSMIEVLDTPGIDVPATMTPRTKWYAVKYHWFRTQLAPNGVELVKIDTAVQKGDLFTKGFARLRFETLRRLLLDW